MSIGSRYDDRIIGQPAKFGAKAVRIHIDIDPSEMDKMIKCHHHVVGDAKKVVDQLNLLVERTGAVSLKRLVTSRENLLLVAGIVHEHGPIRMDDLSARSGLNPYTAEGAVLWLAKFDRVQIDV